MAKYNTYAYYDIHAKQYADRTSNINMSVQQDRFLSFVPQYGRLLDVGFGSGRDMITFVEKGYKVEGIDASTELTRMVKEKGLDARCVSIQEWCDQLQESSLKDDKYDGIWACASILHLEESDIYRFFHCASKAMKKNGVLFVSVKNGITTGLDDQGRYFTNFTEDLLSEICKENPQLSLIERWESSDGMDREGFVWWNLIFRNVDDIED